MTGSSCKRSVQKELLQVGEQRMTEIRHRSTTEMGTSRMFLSVFFLSLSAFDSHS